MADAIFRDFIPEGEDPGAVGSGYRDFVPTPEVQPEPQAIEEAPEEPTESEEVIPVEVPTPEVKGGNRRSR